MREGEQEVPKGSQLRLRPRREPRERTSTGGDGPQVPEGETVSREPTTCEGTRTSGPLGPFRSPTSSPATISDSGGRTSPGSDRPEDGPGVRPPCKRDDPRTDVNREETSEVSSNRVTCVGRTGERVRDGGTGWRCRGRTVR